MDQVPDHALPLDGLFQDITTITLRRLVPAARDLLVQQGCTLREMGQEETLITFPANTQRQRIWPTTISERYRIMLPNGQELRQVFDHIQGINQLFIVLEKNDSIGDVVPE